MGSSWPTLLLAATGDNGFDVQLSAMNSPIRPQAGPRSQPRKTLSICIPVFNESANIPRAIREVEALFAPASAPLSRYALEIVVTDNGSSDDTWEVVRRLSASRPWLKAYRFSRNFGYQNSVFAGLSMATGDAVIELDADLEDPPQVIPEFVKHWEQGCQVAYGVRSKRYAPILLKAAFRCFYWILNRVSDLKIPENTGDFRLLDRRVVDVLKALPERNLYLRGLVTYLGFRQVEVRYDRQPRSEGRSKFRVRHYFVLAIDAVTAFTKAPLRLIGVAGLALFVLSISVALYYLIGQIVHGTPTPGFTTLVILTLVMNSITYIFLGVLGEYLSRVFDDSKHRPRVIIAETLHDDRAPRYL